MPSLPGLEVDWRSRISWWRYAAILSATVCLQAGRIAHRCHPYGDSGKIGLADRGSKKMPSLPGLLRKPRVGLVDSGGVALGAYASRPFWRKSGRGWQWGTARGSGWQCGARGEQKMRKPVVGSGGEQEPDFKPLICG